MPDQVEALEHHYVLSNQSPSAEKSMQGLCYLGKIANFAVHIHGLHG